MQVCHVSVWFSVSRLYWVCAHRGVGRLGVFALINHKRKTVVYILNTLIPWRTSPLTCYLPAPGALITVGYDAVIYWEEGGVKGVGEPERETDGETHKEKKKEREREEAKSWWYLFSPVAASGSFLLSSLLINRWNIRFWAHIAVFYAHWMRLHLNALWSRSREVCEN